MRHLPLLAMALYQIVAPPNVYFGKVKMSVPAIRATLADANAHVAEGSARAIAEIELSNIMDALADWIKQFPGDPSIPILYAEVCHDYRVLGDAASATS